MEDILSRIDFPLGPMEKGLGLVQIAVVDFFREGMEFGLFL
jgi:hypothetical protein